MRVQGLLGSDIAMQLDVCPAGGAPRTELVGAVERTLRWTERCLRSKSNGQALFGIIQGGTDVELRLSHAERLQILPVDGLALGGFSVGEPIEHMHRVLNKIGPVLDPTRPHYLMGVGTPFDIIQAMGSGIDMFDCVMPTRNARNGQAFTHSGKLMIRNARYRNDERPIDEQCGCSGCRVGYSRAYIRYLYLAGEILALRILTLHNLTFYQTLVTQGRQAIVEGNYAIWATQRLAELSASEGAALPSKMAVSSA